MELRETKRQQEQRLEELCQKNDVQFASLQELLNSARIKKMMKRNNYHQQKINKIIENNIK